MTTITLEAHIRLLHEDIAQLHKATKTKNEKKRQEAIKERNKFLNDNGYEVVSVLDINGLHKTYVIHEYLFDDTIEKEVGQEHPSWAVIELGSYYFDEDEFS